MNLKADAFTRTHQIATSELKQKLRDEGCKATDERMHGLRKAIGDHLARHPEIVERAAMEVASWRKKGRRIRARETPDFWALLTTVRDPE